jgi:RNA polymerase sigma-70 factor (ECF subfamily)
LAGSIGRLEIRGGLKGYLISCVVNGVREKFRRIKFDLVKLDDIGPLVSSSDRPEQTIILNEETRLMTEALARIPFEQREVIILRIKGGLKFTEIAKIQRVSVNTVQGRYRYGLDKLRSAMNVRLDDEAYG